MSLILGYPTHEPVITSRFFVEEPDSGVDADGFPRKVVTRHLQLVAGAVGSSAINPKASEQDEDFERFRKISKWIWDMP